MHFSYVEQGIKVDKLAVGSLAGEVGVRPGDIIIGVDGHSIESAEMRQGEVMLRLSGLPGSKVRITIIREGMNTPIEIDVERIDLKTLRSQ